MKTFTISLRNRLAFTYTLFIAAALGILAIAMNLLTGVTFNALVKENISVKSGEIVRAMSELYKPMTRDFDVPAVETIGMYFVHEGYIVSVEDARGEAVWNARACDMSQCRSVIDDITSRMENQFRVKGGMQKQRYTMQYNGMTIGAVLIESYGPYFYSETETEFLDSMNRLLTIAGVIFLLLGAAVSAAVSGAIARPVNKAGEAARMIADAHMAGGAKSGSGTPIRIPDDYKTRELAGLSRSINRLASELEEAERRQKRLTADIAHELRTPLTCLQGNMEAMIDGVYEADREHLVSCHEEITRLSALVRDLNTLTGLEWETLTLNKTDFDLAKLLRTTAEQFQSAAVEKGIELRLNLPSSPINADYDRLKQVFINLLSNAFQYTEAGNVTVSIEKILDKRRVSVADTGIGIPESGLSRIFERFYREDSSRSRNTGGAGIGLTIAAAIVHAHNGTIGASSDGKGSVFYVTL